VADQAARHPEVKRLVKVGRRLPVEEAGDNRPPVKLLQLVKPQRLPQAEDAEEEAVEAVVRRTPTRDRKSTSISANTLPNSVTPMAKSPA